MSVWFFIVLVIGICYALNRLTSTTDLPVSTRLAQAREIAERGTRAHDAEAASEPAPAQEPAAGTDIAAARRYCTTAMTNRRTRVRSRHLTRH